MKRDNEKEREELIKEARIAAQFKFTPIKNHDEEKLVRRCCATTNGKREFKKHPSPLYAI